MSLQSSPIHNSYMNKIAELCTTNISWKVSQAVYHNTNCVMTECIVTPLIIIMLKENLFRWTNF